MNLQRAIHSVPYVAVQLTILCELSEPLPLRNLISANLRLNRDFAICRPYPINDKLLCGTMRALITLFDLIARVCEQCYRK